MACALNNNTIELEDNEEYFRDKYEFLMGVLPDANPIFLKDKCKEYYENENEFHRFIRKSLQTKQYPRKTDYERELERFKEKELYKSNFTVEEFLKNIQNPEEYFSEKSEARVNRLKHLRFNDIEYAETFLKNYFPNLYVKDIKETFRRHSQDLMKTVEDLKKIDAKLKKKRVRYTHFDHEKINLYLLQEIAYIEHREEILSFIENKKTEKQNAIKEARNNNLLNSCECCFDDEVIPEETVSCENGHNFCIDCTKKGCEVALEQGKQEFSCLANCDNFFNIIHLKMVLQPKVYENISRSNQLKEIKAASIENLEFCPDCNFAAIVSPLIKVFSCLNSDCLKETCRLCRQSSHVPFRCDEEFPNEVKARTLIEDKMTEALVRTCYKCNMKFLKEDGCNKMTCPCGATMCYVCKQPVSDYTHFNGKGGDKYHLCPLFSNTDELHANNVLEEARELRKSMNNKKTKLKVDPTENIEAHYEGQRKKRCSSCGGRT